MSGSIPRFLLPQRSSIWISRLSPQLMVLRTIRNASSKAPKAPKLPAGKTVVKPPPKPAAYQTPVLEKPSKFTPPSHPQRINQRPRQYPGPPLSQSQKTAQAKKHYPNMMPAPGTLSHRILNSHVLHMSITLGVLFSVAGWSFYLRFKESKFGDMLPPLSDAFYHPITFFRTFAEVVKLEGLRQSEETKERRARKVDDISKRAAYRKAHGMETEGFGGWTALTSEQSLGPALDVQSPKASLAIESGEGQAVGEESAVQEDGQRRRRPPVKKWLGIW